MLALSEFSKYDKDFPKHDLELLSVNLGTADLSYVMTDSSEDENPDIQFTLESLNWNISRLASGRINNSTLDRVRKMKGGWYTLPFYGLADKSQTNYFRFKPLNPPTDKLGKDIKYLSAIDSTVRAYAPNVPESLWATIADRHGVEKSEGEFWEWILANPDIPVIVTEGEKKALAGLAAGYPAISLPGFQCGSVTTSRDNGKDKTYKLLPDLEALAAGGRTIYLAFDRDSKSSTVRAVNLERAKLAGLFFDKGCQTLSIRWGKEFKGFDDFIFGAGLDSMRDAIESADNITPTVRESGESGEKKEKIPSALEMSKKVFSDVLKNRIRLDSSVKQYWEYDQKGKWVSCSDDRVFGIVQEYLEEWLSVLSPSYIRNVIDLAKKDFQLEGWTEASNLLYIPFTNGVLELKTKQLLPHSPDYGFTWQLPRPYSAIDASWGNINRFLDELTNNNPHLKNLAIAFCNAVLVGRHDLQKFLYLFGSGGNGKGVLASLLEMLVGKENTHSTTIKELNENRFEASNLKGKRLVRMNDEDKRVGGLSIFKSATGGDPIRFERKGKDATNFLFTGMVVVAANSPTFVGDSNKAIKRRKVDFPCLFSPTNVRDLRPELEADLTAFTTYLLSIPDEWVSNTIRKADSVEAVRKLNWELTVRENSIAAFYDEKLILDANGSIASGHLYKTYQAYCEESGLKSQSLKNFSPNLLELCNDSLGHSISTKRTSAGVIVKGLRLREAWEFGEAETDRDVTDNTSEITPPTLSKTANSLIESINPTHPTQAAQSNDSNLHVGSNSAYTPYTKKTKQSQEIKEGDSVYIPNSGKHGTVERVAKAEGKEGLWARVKCTDNKVRDVLVEFVMLA